MERFETRQRGFAWRLVGAAIAPFIVSSTYLFFTRWPSYRFTTFSDKAGVAISVLAGAAFVASLPMRPLQRLLSLLLYVPLVVILLLMYTFLFIAVVFHEAL